MDFNEANLIVKYSHRISELTKIAAANNNIENEMYEKYDGMIRGRTGIFISHRLSSTRFCDRILFMEKGRIVEEGDHESLMEKKGAYAELFGLQARYYQQKRQQEESYA